MSLSGLFATTVIIRDNPYGDYETEGADKIFY